MTDTIIKGTGNSRTIKTVPNIKAMVSSLDDLLDLFIAGFPVDILGLNPTGVQVAGTDLTKGNLLTDETATGMGLTSSATPNDALAKLHALVTTAQNTANLRALITSGSYVGSGKSGSAYPNSLAFSFAPKILILTERISGYDAFPLYYSYGYNESGLWLIDTGALSTSYRRYIGFLNHQLRTSGEHLKPYSKKSSDGKIIYWYVIASWAESASSFAYEQFNESGATYRYIAIG